MAKANSAARSLIEISKTQGWDSTRIWDQAAGAYTADLLTPWDHPREPFDRGLGEIPGELPNVRGSIDPTGGPVLTEEVTWNKPDTSRESRENGHPKMTLSDSDPGKEHPDVDSKFEP